MQIALPDKPFRNACIGRDDDVQRLREVFERERLVTLVGGGGIGKTCLAVELARTLAPELPVYFCELAEVHDEAGALDAVAAALGTLAPGDGAPADPIGEAIAARGVCLLVLDNCEQLAAELARLVGRWSAAAGEARFLVTSREALGLREEVRYEVTPLALPAEDDDVEHAAAGQLFIAQVRRRQRGFAIARHERATAARLLRQLEGIPLAIEVVAARVAALGLEPTAARLDASTLDLPSGSARDADRRH